jgi:hypothetical protein
MGDRAMGDCGRAVAIQLIFPDHLEGRGLIASHIPEIKRPMVVPDTLTPWHTYGIHRKALLSFASGGAPC